MLCRESIDPQIAAPAIEESHAATRRQPADSRVPRLFGRESDDLSRHERADAKEPGRSPNLARALISSLLASEEVSLVVRSRMREGRRLIAGVVAAGQAAGQVDPRLKPERVAVQLVQACLGTVILWSLDGRPSLASRFEETFRHFWRSIVTSAAAGGKKQR